MADTPNRYRQMGIRLRMAFMFWLVTVITGSMFVFILVPYLKSTFQEGLYAKAYQLAAALQEEISKVGTDAMPEDLSELCDGILTEDKSVMYLVRTHLDGASVVQTRSGTREEDLGGSWVPPATATGEGKIVAHPFEQTNVYHFTYALDEPSGGRIWLHVGLSTAKYQRDLHGLYRHTAQIGLVCMLVSLVLSFVYAQRMVNPLLKLQQVVREVALGDLQVRARLSTGDEVEELANCFNEMTLSMEQTHEQLKQAKEVAEEASRVKTRFLANMSHEVRTPMNGIMSTMKLLKGTKLSTNQARYIDTALKSSSALLGLLNDILDITKIEAGKMELEQREFSLSEAVEHALQVFQEGARTKGLQLCCLVDGAMPARLWGDDMRLGQILMNLLSNALKFTESGGIELGARVVGVTDTQTKVRISVRDSGIGIPVEKQGTLFRRFTQEDSSITRKYGGSGLGLAISRELVELMGGSIHVDSQPDEGATFWFELSLINAAEMDGTCEAAFPTLGGARVLVVESTDKEQAYFDEQLASWGAVVEVVGDADTALDRLQSGGDGSYRAVILMNPWRDETTQAAHRRLAEWAFSRQIRPVVIGHEESLKDRVLTPRVACDALCCPVLPTELYEAVSGWAANGCTPLFADCPVCEPTRIIPPGSKARILLAEDHLVNQEITRELLNQWGYECECASTGKQAVAAVGSRVYDLVLMDCQMPEMDGYEATRVIRAAEKDRDGGGAQIRLPIVALTANTAMGDRQRCLESGMDACLSKPLEVDHFKEVVSKILGQEYTTYEAPIPVESEVVPPATEEPDPVCDNHTLLSRCGGSPDRVQRIVTCFADQTRQDVDRILAALGAGDALGVSAPAHRIKGAAANLTARRLQISASVLERAGKEGDLDRAEAAATDLRMEFEGFLEAISLPPESGEREGGAREKVAAPELENVGVTS